jgi:hypothetical protein
MAHRNNQPENGCSGCWVVSRTPSFWLVFGWYPERQPEKTGSGWYSGDIPNPRIPSFLAGFGIISRAPARKCVVVSRAHSQNGLFWLVFRWYPKCQQEKTVSGWYSGDIPNARVPSPERVFWVVLGYPERPARNCFLAGFRVHNCFGYPISAHLHPLPPICVGASAYGSMTDIFPASA